MSREIPEVVRAAAGLAATVLDEARKLPETLPGLPVRLIGQALQTSLRLQQQYSGLVARGDEVFTGLRGDAEPGLATFDDDLPAPPPPAGTPAPRSSAFDRVADLPEETDADERADVLADDLAVDALPVADAEVLPDDVAVAVLGQDAPAAEEITPAEVAALPDDPAADAITAVVDELADEVADEISEEVPDALPDEVLADLTADTVADVAEDERAIEDAVTDEVIADAAVGGTPPGDVAGAPADTAPVEDDLGPDVPALEDAAAELVDLGGPEAAESVTPGSPVTDSAASDPLVPAGDQPAGARPAVSAPVEGYDGFSIPALRGHLRSYPAETVADLLDYERATRARAPYVTLLQNRLEKLSADRG
ncbi:lipid droplet-associated protein [Modestobacter sp. SYSU DS0290]